MLTDHSHEYVDTWAFLERRIEDMITTKHVLDEVCYKTVHTTQLRNIKMCLL